MANILIVQPLPNYVVITKHDVNYNDKVILNNNIMAILKTNNIVPIYLFAIIRGIYIYFWILFILSYLFYKSPLLFNTHNLMLPKNRWKMLTSPIFFSCGPLSWIIKWTFAFNHALVNVYTILLWVSSTSVREGYNLT